ncbi:hypothetical protein NECAME_18059, partial [Necator americanus]
ESTRISLLTLPGKLSKSQFSWGTETPNKRKKGEEKRCVRTEAEEDKMIQWVWFSSKRPPVSNFATPSLNTQALHICTRQAPPVILDDSMGDTVALLGQDVDFTCKVDNLGKHMVAFVRASTPPRLISFDEK